MGTCRHGPPGLQPCADLPQPHGQFLPGSGLEDAARTAGEDALSSPSAACTPPPCAHQPSPTFPLLPGGHQLCHCPGYQVQPGHPQFPPVARRPPGLGPQLREQRGRSAVCCWHGQRPRGTGRLETVVEGTTEPCRVALGCLSPLWALIYSSENGANSLLLRKIILRISVRSCRTPVHAHVKHMIPKSTGCSMNFYTCTLPCDCLPDVGTDTPSLEKARCALSPGSHCTDLHHHQ